MKYKTVRNLQWANRAQSVINCEVDFDDLVEEFVPFSASATDMYEHTKDIFTRAIAGDFGQIAEYVPPADIIGTDAIQGIRAKRNNKLKSEIDPIVTNPLRWAALTTAQQNAFIDYRQALLDITTSYPNPSYVWNESTQEYDEAGIVWPIVPI